MSRYVNKTSEEKFLDIKKNTFAESALLWRGHITITIEKYVSTYAKLSVIFISPDGVESLERAWWRGLLSPCLILWPGGPLLPTLQAEPDRGGRWAVARPGLWDLQLTTGSVKLLTQSGTPGQLRWHPFNVAVKAACSDLMSNLREHFGNISILGMLSAVRRAGSCLHRDGSGTRV